MRVDAVITWVDGSDPEWRAKRSQFTPNRLPGSNGNAEQHFRDNGELRYLLRSLEKYWPFSGDIILVTDGQKPDFIDQNSDIRFVDHSEILDKQYLPTFSSRAIASSLHKIPGLSERFVVFSDDMFLSRETSIEDYFGLRGARAYLSNEPVPDEEDDELSRYHQDAFAARSLIKDYLGGEGLGSILSPHPQGVTKSNMERLERRFPEVFHRARHEKFVSPGTYPILPYLYYEYCHTAGFADTIKDDTLFLYGYDLSNDFFRDQVKKAIDDKFSFCIQDTLRRKKDVIEFREELKRLLDDVFPVPSCWERE